MRIAFVTSQYVTEAVFDGGLANYIHRVSLSLLKLGHQPIVVVSSDRNETFVQDDVEIHRTWVAESLSSEELWIKRMNYVTRKRFRMSLYLLRQSWRLNARVKQIHDEQPLTLIQYPQLEALGLFKLSSVPSVIRLSSYTPLWEAKGEYDHVHSFGIIQQKLWERWALKRADGIFGPGRIVASIVEKDLGKPVEVIETPFSLKYETTDEALYREVLQNKTYLLFLGRFNVTKGIFTIADTIHELLGKYPFLYFVFIGREHGNCQGTPIKDYIIQKAGDYRDRVVFLGAMRHKQLYPILNHAHSVVLPSLIDNFPNTCLEAMAHKCVVIGTRGASFEQLLVDGESGLLCEIGNTASLLEALDKALSMTEEQRRKMGEKAYERVRQLKPEIVVRQLVDFYQKIMAKRGVG